MLQKFHRFGAIYLIVFVLLHLSVHLTALAGLEAHQAALSFVQGYYRHPLGEALLVAVVLSQVFSGLRRVRFKGQRGMALAQAVSGAYLAFFLVVHTTAALNTHHIFKVETDVFWAAGSLKYFPLNVFFAIYYTAAIIAFFTHMAAAVYYNFPRAAGFAAIGFPAAGLVVAGLILTPLSGALYEIELPEDTKRYYQMFYPQAD